MLTPRTNVHPFDSLRTPFDIFLNALFDHGHNSERSLLKYMFYKFELQQVPRHEFECIRREISLLKRGNTCQGLQTPKKSLQDMGLNKVNKKAMFSIWPLKKSNNKNNMQDRDPNNVNKQKNVQDMGPKKVKETMFGIWSPKSCKKNKS